jgi:hypothetical protein
LSYNGSPFTLASLAIARRRSLSHNESCFVLFSPSGHPHSGARLAVFSDFFSVLNFYHNIFRRSFVSVFAKRFVFAIERAGKAAKKKTAIILLGIRGQHSFRGPAKLIAALNGAVINSRLFGPLHERHRKPVISHINISSGIVGLLFPSRPMAILRAVRAVIVGALKGVFIRRVAHVGQERVKINPSRTNFDAPTTISVIMDRFRVITSGLHLNPDTINSRIRQPVPVCHEVVITYCKELSNEL